MRLLVKVKTVIVFQLRFLVIETVWGFRAECANCTAVRVLAISVSLLFHYITTLPSSAAVERLFSLGNDILKPKRCGLSDEHFEILAFLKGY